MHEDDCIRPMTAKPTPPVECFTRLRHSNFVLPCPVQTPKNPFDPPPVRGTIAAPTPRLKPLPRRVHVTTHPSP